MNDSINICYFIAFIFFLAFIISAVFSLADRKVIRKKLRHAGLDRYDACFSAGLTQINIVNTWKVLRFFVFAKWEGIKSPELLLYLKKHRRIEILAILSFFIAQTFFLLALVLDGKLN